MSVCDGIDCHQSILWEYERPPIDFSGATLRTVRSPPDTASDLLVKRCKFRIRRLNVQLESDSLSNSGANKMQAFLGASLPLCKVAQKQQRLDQGDVPFV